MRLFIVSCFFVLLGVSSYTASAEAGSEFIHQLANTGINALTDKTLDDKTRQDRFRNIFISQFDVSSISKFTLGRYWNQADATQRDTYRDLFTELVVRQYAALFKKYSGQTLNVKSETAQDTTRITVHSVLNHTNGKQIAIDWKLRAVDGSFKIMDVVVEGVSMAVSQREEIVSVMQTQNNNIAQLLVTLQNKVTSSN